MSEQRAFQLTVTRGYVSERGPFFGKDTFVKEPTNREATVKKVEVVIVGGGFGFTFECDAPLFLSQALWCMHQLGDGYYPLSLLEPILLEQVG